ncbi:hypothetical protein BJV82DRAFT_671920 [Fennellomyces sp. T-0311]|nr:hypothetical protein BJV82DRAFT_671920 [Fennellomyces sp. T-0311]
MTSNTSTNTSASQGTGSKKLTVQELKNVNAMFSSLDKEKMWRLSSGKLVEEKMQLVANKSTHEHASHSLIMDPSDVAYQEHFNEAELEEIKTFNAPEVLPLPDKIAEFVNKFKGVTDLKELEALVWSFKFDPVEEPDLRWIHVSIINALDLLHYEYTNKEHSGADLLKRVWSFIDGCFDATEILARR